jgi:hypothetical protein
MLLLLLLCAVDWGLKAVLQRVKSCCHPIPNEENSYSSWGNSIFSLQNHADEFSFGESDVQSRAVNFI